MLFKSFITSLTISTSILAAPVELEVRQPCSGLQLVHLAGTTEVGLGLVGIPLSKALASAVPGTTTHSIPYSTIPEYTVTVSEGASMTASYLKSQAANCPNQRFVLSGYSKGVMVLHKTNLDSDVKDKVISVLAFGDPKKIFNDTHAWPINSASVNETPRNGSTSDQNVASFCNSGDIFCDTAGASLPAHLAYGIDGSTDIAANFVKAQISKR